MTLPEDGWYELGFLGPPRPSSSAEDYRKARAALPLMPDGLIGPAIRMLTEPSPLLDEWLRQHPIKPMTRRERWALRVRSARERVALRFAPWLDRDDEW